MANVTDNSGRVIYMGQVKVPHCLRKPKNSWNFMDLVRFTKVSSHKCLEDFDHMVKSDCLFNSGYCNGPDKSAHGG